MTKKLLIGLAILTLSFSVSACNKDQDMSPQIQEFADGVTNSSNTGTAANHLGQQAGIMANQYIDNNSENPEATKEKMNQKINEKLPEAKKTVKDYQSNITQEQADQNVDALLDITASNTSDPLTIPPDGN